MAQRTLLQTVQTVVAALGEQPPSTLITPSPTTIVAIGAVNDAVSDIYSRARWEFRLKQFFVTLSTGDAVYGLPEDFGEMHTTFFPLPGAENHIVFLPFTELMAMYSDLRLLRNDVQKDSQGLSLSMIPLAASYQLARAGSPQYFSVNGNDLIVWPPPAAEFCDTGHQLMISYFRLPAELSNDGDVLPLPSNLWPACTYLAQAFVKQYKESDDYRIDEQRAERMINLQLSRKERRTNAPQRFKVRSY